MTSEKSPVSGTYACHPVEHVLYGPGSLARWRELPAFGSASAVLVTTPSISRSPLLARVTAEFASILLATFAESRQHAPVSVVEQVAHAIQESGAGAVISLGGGSVIDTVKAAIDLRQKATGSFLPHLALPTTLSAAEFATSYGMTDDVTRRKRRGNAAGLLPAGVVLDAELTLQTPDWLWLGSGLRALDHAVETVYAPDHNPAADALALAAIRRLFRVLPESTPAQDRLTERQEAQIAAWLSFACNGTITFGPSHRLGRLIGPIYDVPHGLTSAILLPHVMRELLPETAERQLLIARAARAGSAPEGEDSAEEAAELVAALVQQLDLPRRLRDVGVPHRDIPGLAQGDERDLRILQSAW